MRAVKVLKWNGRPELETDEDREIWFRAYCAAFRSTYMSKLTSPDDSRNYAQKCADIAVQRLNE